MHCSKINFLFIGIIALPLLMQTYQEALPINIPAPAQEQAIPSSGTIHPGSFHLVSFKPRIGVRDLRRFYGALRKKIVLVQKGRAAKTEPFRTRVYFPGYLSTARSKGKTCDWCVELEILL